MQGKRLYVQGTALLDTEIARDPRNPLQCDNIAELLEPCTGPVHHYAVSDLEGEAVGIGAGAYTFDAVSPDHLTYIARQAVDSGRRILWIGSAGLAEALLVCRYPARSRLAACGAHLYSAKYVMRAGRHARWNEQWLPQGQRADCRPIRQRKQRSRRKERSNGR